MHRNISGRDRQTPLSTAGTRLSLTRRRDASTEMDRKAILTLRSDKNRKLAFPH